MNTYPHPHHIFTQKTPFKDPDVEHLKFLISKTKVVDPILHPHQSRDQQTHIKIQMLERKIAQLTHKLAEKQRENFQVVTELRAEKQQRRKDNFINENKINALSKQIEEISKLTTLNKPIQRNSIGNKSPSSNKMVDSFHFRRTQTPINELLEMSQHFSPTKDQIHRLNSYLIENTTTLKLLLEKHNYLLKIREIGSSNDRQQRQLIEKTKRIINDRKAVQQAKFTLNTSRKYDFQQDSSSSEIETENNVIVQKEE